MGWFRNRAVHIDAADLSGPEPGRRRARLLASVWPLAALAFGVAAMLAWIAALGWGAYQLARLLLN